MTIFLTVSCGKLLFFCTCQFFSFNPNGIVTFLKGTIGSGRNVQKLEHAKIPQSFPVKWQILKLHSTWSPEGSLTAVLKRDINNELKNKKCMQYNFGNKTEADFSIYKAQFHFHIKQVHVSQHFLLDPFYK